MNEYTTVKSESSAEFIERKSKFIGYICPVQTEDEAIEFVNKIRKKHPDATHNVYAYLTREGNKQRYSDDGEPQGTAGIPVLEILLKSGITDCAVVVTRYFGGVLLGAGGLVRAYAHAAKLAVAAGEPVKMVTCYECDIVCDYSRYNMLQILLSEHEAEITDTQFTENIKISFYIEADKFDALCADLTEKTGGTVDVCKNSEKFMPIKIKI
ncbi:MAG: YigZ family protein [Clostridia bacterium]|nr:YigZ family protein [Clostridia bacterium]